MLCAGDSRGTPCQSKVLEECAFTGQDAVLTASDVEPCRGLLSSASHLVNARRPYAETSPMACVRVLEPKAPSHHPIESIRSREEGAGPRRQRRNAPGVKHSIPLRPWRACHTVKPNHFSATPATLTGPSPLPPSCRCQPPWVFPLHRVPGSPCPRGAPKKGAPAHPPRGQQILDPRGPQERRRGGH